MAFRLQKHFQNILGLDLRKSDLLRDQGAATEVNNVMYRQTGALSKRKGYQIKTNPATGGAGLHKFNNIDINTGVITEELLCMDDNLHIYTQNTFNLSYSGAGNAFYDMYFNTTDNVFYFEVYEDGGLISQQNLGTGQGASDMTVSTLVTNLNALTDFSASVTGSPSTPAAFLDLERNVTISTNTVKFYTWAQIDTPNNYSGPFTNHWAARNNDDFEICSVATINDAFYISNGYDNLHKYDGNRIYRAGLPTPATFVGVEVTGTTFGVGETYTHKALYEYTDAKGNIVLSNGLDDAAVVLSGTKDIDVTVANIQDTTGFNTDQATINGTQVGVRTITVNSGHNIKVDDTVYINDGITGTVVSRTITATTATTITFGTSEDTVDVTNAEIISCIKIRIFRTKDAGTIYYELVDLINDSANATQTYTDQTADSGLVVEFVEPIRGRDLPPKGKYIDVWRNNLIITGDRTNVNTVYFSDIDSPEYFPAASNSFILAAKLGGGNTGLKVFDNTLFVFKPESILTVTGDLNNAFQVNPMSDEGIGCIAHATIKEINRRVWFLGNRGVYSVSPSDIRSESEPIEPRFDNLTYGKQSVAFHWIDRDMYVLMLPDLETSGSEDYYGSASKIMVYDKFRRAWLQWSNWNMQGGMAEYNNEIYMQGRELDPVALTAKSYTKKVNEIGNLDDYMDHTTAITFTYKSHWEAIQEPSIFKKFNRIKVLSLDGSINDFETNSFSIDITTEHDYLPSTVSSLSLDMLGGAVGWGGSPWGTFPWGESRLAVRSSKLASKKAKSLRVIFTNDNKQENVLISGWEYEVALPYNPAIKE